MRSCLSIKPDEGYREARRFLKESFEQGYAYVDCVTNGPTIKYEDGRALQRFSVLLTSCKNTLREIGFLNKIENPDSLQRVIERLPFPLRQRWRDVADDITGNKQRENTIEDIAQFVESKARALTHPIFGNIVGNVKTKDPKNPRIKRALTSQL